MNSPEPIPDPALSRRAAMRRAILGLAAGAATSLPISADAAQPVVKSPETFLPENDYPYFGPEPVAIP
jgi:hypothetical protein